MRYKPLMVKEGPLGVRLEKDEKDALDRAAREDDRPLSAMVRKITVQWLVENGYLKREGD